MRENEHVDLVFFFLSVYLLSLLRFYCLFKSDGKVNEKQEEERIEKRRRS